LKIRVIEVIGTNCCWMLVKKLRDKTSNSESHFLSCGQFPSLEFSFGFRRSVSQAYYSAAGRTQLQNRRRILMNCFVSKKSLVFLCSFVLVSIMTHASNFRTYVSVAGNDGNAGMGCPANAPCRNVNAALRVTFPHGEV